MFTEVSNFCTLYKSVLSARVFEISSSRKSLKYCSGVRYSSEGSETLSRKVRPAMMLSGFRHRYTLFVVLTLVLLLAFVLLVRFCQTCVIFIVIFFYRGDFSITRKQILWCLYVITTIIIIIIIIRLLWQRRITCSHILNYMTYFHFIIGHILYDIFYIFYYL